MDAVGETRAAPVVPDWWLDRAVELEERFCREIYRVPAREAVLNLTRGGHALYDAIAPHLAPDSRVLEVGAGYGFGLVDLLQRGVDAIGVEPGDSATFEGRYDMAYALLEANGCDTSRLVKAS